MTSFVQQACLTMTWQCAAEFAAHTPPFDTANPYNVSGVPSGSAGSLMLKGPHTLAMSMVANKLPDTHCWLMWAPGVPIRYCLRARVRHALGVPTRATVGARVPAPIVELLPVLVSCVELAVLLQSPPPDGHVVGARVVGGSVGAAVYPSHAAFALKAVAGPYLDQFVGIS